MEKKDSLLPNMSETFAFELCVNLIGISNDNIEYDHGQLTMKYTSGNGSCRQRQNFSTTIRFTCDHKKRGTDGPKYLPDYSTSCSHQFEWHTSLACLPFRFKSCCSLRFVDINNNNNNKTIYKAQ